MSVDGNLFAPLKQKASDEVIEDLLQTSGLRLERIVSTGQTTPPGEWYDQRWDEWVVMLSGAADLRFEESGKTLSLEPGDYLLIPAHCRHRVERTAEDCETVWLALHFDPT